jgi:hypothetical protein
MTEPQPAPPTTTEPHRRPAASTRAARQDRINLLNLAVETAEDDSPPPFHKLHRFAQARVDVLLDAVLDRTLSALEEASDYLLDKGVL